MKKKIIITGIITAAVLAAAAAVFFGMRARQMPAPPAATAKTEKTSGFPVATEDISEIVIKSADRTIDIYIPKIKWLENNVWHMKEPYDTMASDAFIDSSILPQLGSITFSEEAKEPGAERARLTVTVGGKEYEFILGSDKDGKTPVEYNGKVYLEPTETFAFVDADIHDYLSRLVSYVNINAVDRVTMEYGDKKHTIEIKGDKKTDFIADGKKKETEPSRELYIELIGVLAAGLYNGQELGETVLTVSFEGEEPTRVEYKRLTDEAVAVVKNGKAIFVTHRIDIDTLIGKINEYYGGE